MLLEKKFTNDFDYDENKQIGIDENNFFVIKQYEEDLILHYYNKERDENNYHSVLFINENIEDLIDYIKRRYSKGKTLEQIFEKLSEE